jgi:hypothetical protein
LWHFIRDDDAGDAPGMSAYRDLVRIVGHDPLAEARAIVARKAA